MSDAVETPKPKALPSKQLLPGTVERVDVMSARFAEHRRFVIDAAVDAFGELDEADQIARIVAARQRSLK